MYSIFLMISEVGEEKVLVPLQEKLTICHQQVVIIPTVIEQQVVFVGWLADYTNNPPTWGE